MIGKFKYIYSYTRAHTRVCVYVYVYKTWKYLKIDKPQPYTSRKSAPIYLKWVSLGHVERII